MEAIGRGWPILLPVTVAVFAVALRHTHDVDAPWWTASVGQVAYTWLAIVTLMGVFHTVLATERRGVRYLSDSAYWLYLAHLPLVIWGQVWLGDGDQASPVKFLGLTTAVTLVLLASYQLFVRYTPLGTLLNGSRAHPGRTPTGGC